MCFRFCFFEGTIFNLDLLIERRGDGQVQWTPQEPSLIFPTASEANK